MRDGLQAADRTKSKKRLRWNCSVGKVSWRRGFKETIHQWEKAGFA